MNEKEAAREIEAGRAHGHALWCVLRSPEQRDGYALRPAVWEGSGEYQRVHHRDGRDVYVRIAEGTAFPISECGDHRPAAAVRTEPARRVLGSWERDAYRRALDLLQRLIQDAVPQAGLGYGERDVNREDLNAVCAEAETLLYEARGRA